MTGRQRIDWRGVPRQGLIAFVKGYRVALRPLLGNRCRFAPTCSEYTLEALQRHGAACGAYMGLRRVLRCQPFCDGGHDPVPDRPLRLFGAAVQPASDTVAASSSTSLPSRTKISQ